MARSDFGLTMDVKDFFFDRQKVAQRAEKGMIRGLSKVGAFVRRRARSKLRKRKRVSQPGESPSVHSDDSVATLRNILFALDANSLSVVIGPVRLNQVNQLILSGETGFALQGTVPQLMEFGGESRVFEWDLRGKGEWSRADRRFTRTFERWQKQGILAERTRVRVSRYAPRPFMGPALKEELANVPSGFEAVVTS